MTSPLVTAQWLQQHLHDPNLVILDSSIEFQIPTESEKDWVNKLPNAQRFDYDKVFCDPDSPLPHMMPSEERFNTLARELGINQDSFIVVYDNSGTFASPRAWWMFKAMGHHKVYILNGGLTEWKAQGYNVTQNYREPTPKGNFDGKLNPQAFVDASYVLKQIDNPHSQTIDARGLARFFGEVPEPRPGVRSGHIPGSSCLPFAELITGHKLKEQAELRPLLTHMLPDTAQEYLFSCGSGVTACIVLLAAYVCGYQNLSVYDGSWTEWGQRQDLPIE
ncbi:3-mercaptopyruvate sulfurtransferase [Vibrio cholerae]|uniref:3-mercaptopyruvate sulfurtransferase n=1 Tax=Vibrio cholerae TaxID=666 RepID=UPI000BA9BE0A|nr:3-mercaptopyruvate sulfurtransferase [Vibrio cholerae]PAS31130.1 3-mercaptopyruvate sulfurtransferase [Vibrio cholerae]